MARSQLAAARPAGAVSEREQASRSAPCPSGVRLGVMGPLGFIGSRVVAAAASQGIDVAGIPRFRIGNAEVGDVATAARQWQATHSASFDRLCAFLSGLDVVVNAAGLPEPGSARARALFAANAVHPAVVTLAARAAGVRRLVHVSTAPVQGRLDPLDESPRQHPLSPYAASKAASERFLLDRREWAPPEVVIYRPTSVHDPSRTTTRQLALFLSLPAVPVVGTGAQHLPVALADNVGAGIVFAATMPAAPEIVLQPSEGMTVRRLMELLAARRVVSLPANPAEVGRKVLVRAGAATVRTTALARRVEVLLWGQGIQATTLCEAGFVAPVGPEGWEQLAAKLREGLVQSNGDLAG